MKRIFKVFLPLLLMLLMVLNASAVFDAGIHPNWVYVTSVDGSISISTGGTATITATGNADSLGINKTEIAASLQQLKGGQWTEVKSWNAVASGRSVSILAKGWPVAHGFSYRLVVEEKAYNGSTLKETAGCTKNYGYYK